MSDPLVEEWVEKAEEDYQTAEYLYSKSKEKFLTIICFHAQQSVEKYLKALLTKYKISPPKTHSLEALLDLIVSSVPEFEEYDELFESLTPYSVEYRYPGVSATPEDAQQCMEIAQKLRCRFREVLESESPNKERYVG